MKKTKYGMLVSFLLITSGYWGLSNTAFSWPVENGVAVCTASSGQNYPQIISNGQRGAIISWQDSRSGTSDIYAQAIDITGTVKWILDGVSISTASGNQCDPRLVSDGEGGAIITWWDTRNGPSKVYAQAVDSTGTVKWNMNGVPVCTALSMQDHPEIVTGGQGGAIITWEDNRNGNTNIYIQAIDSTGTLQWSTNGAAICIASVYQKNPKLISDGQNGTIITWEDYRNSNYDIYAQAIDSTGAIKWILDGVAVCTASTDQVSPQLVSDGQGGAIVTWKDYRNGNYDIYTQAIDSTGTVKWILDGVAICTVSGGQNNPQLVSDGHGGAIITWDDSNIYTQAVDSVGTLKWTLDGVAISLDANSYKPRIVSDGQSGAIITWEDYRLGTHYDIFAQSIDSTGTIQWETNGVAICTASNGQGESHICINETREVIVTWQDFRSGNDLDIYTQSVNNDGIVPVELSKFYYEP